ncbi:MAG: hypothetical protein UU87_C0001G0077 [Parcubacteria group bacterium GW2011_GWA2_42_11]|nr:MAG: hypothetical protein UU87_C0001G0077 [Parcubacteria group bacterium GW2011_GWA2_42_11]
MAITLSGANNNVSFLTPEQKKQRKMLVFLGVIILGLAVILYFGYFRKTAEQPVGPATSSGISQGQAKADLMERIKNLNTEGSIYQDKGFAELKLHGDLPLVIGERGRSNPFAPF